MCDCFPTTTGGGIPVLEQCQQMTGNSEYAGNFNVMAKSFMPEYMQRGEMWKQRYSFSKGPRFGIPPFCNCTPPQERSRFETTYNHNFNESSAKRHPAVDGVQPQFEERFLPKQFLCPLTTETTYARSFDMPQAHIGQICGQQEPCGGCSPPCDDNACNNPCGIEIRYTPKTRKYPIAWNTPRYVPDSRVPPRRPKLLCGGGTPECPVQNQYPTQQAIKEDMEELETERCRLESLYGSSNKYPPYIEHKNQFLEGRHCEVAGLNRYLMNRILEEEALDLMDSILHRALWSPTKSTKGDLETEIDTFDIIMARSKTADEKALDTSFEERHNELAEGKIEMFENLVCEKLEELLSLSTPSTCNNWIDWTTFDFVSLLLDPEQPDSTQPMFSADAYE